MPQQRFTAQWRIAQSVQDSKNTWNLRAYKGTESLLDANQLAAFHLHLDPRGSITQLWNHIFDKAWEFTLWDEQATADGLSSKKMVADKTFDPSKARLHDLQASSLATSHNIQSVCWIPKKNWVIWYLEDTDIPIVPPVSGFYIKLFLKTCWDKRGTEQGIIMNVESLSPIHITWHQI